MSFLNLKSHSYYKEYTTAERYIQERPKKTGPSGKGPGRPVICQFCMHRPGVKYIWSQEYLFSKDGRDCTDGWPSEKCRNKGPTCTPPHEGMPRAPTTPRITTNVNKKIGEATKDALILWQFKHQVVFHPYIQEFTPPALTNRSGWPALPDHVGTSQTSHVLTKTAAPNIATQATIGSGKINSNRAQTTDG